MKMKRYQYEIFQDNGTPMMFGIQSDCGVKFGHISTDGQEVSRLAERCNQFQISPVHLGDIIDDFRKS